MTHDAHKQDRLRQPLHEAIGRGLSQEGRVRADAGHQIARLGFLHGREPEPEDLFDQAHARAAHHRFGGPFQQVGAERRNERSDQDQPDEQHDRISDRLIVTERFDDLAGKQRLDQADESANGQQHAPGDEGFPIWPGVAGDGLPGRGGWLFDLHLIHLHRPEQMTGNRQPYSFAPRPSPGRLGRGTGRGPPETPSWPGVALILERLFAARRWAHGFSLGLPARW